MSERTGIDWETELRQAIQAVAYSGPHNQETRIDKAMQIALSRAESAIAEGDVEKYRSWLAARVDAISRELHDVTELSKINKAGRNQQSAYNKGIDAMRQYVLTLLRSRQSGAATEGDDWWCDPFGEWHPNQQPESILPCGIYIRLRFEHDTGYSYNSLDIVIEEENLTTSDIEEPWIGPFPSWIFRSRQSGEQRKWIEDAIQSAIRNDKREHLPGLELALRIIKGDSAPPFTED